MSITKQQASEIECLIFQDAYQNHNGQVVVPWDDLVSRLSSLVEREVTNTELEDAFDVFWQAGLRKLNKRKAESAFKSAYKRVKASFSGSVMDMATQLSEDVKMRLESGQLGFEAMHPTTYLNGNRWEDERVEK